PPTPPQNSSFAFRLLRREAAQRATDVALTQALERAIAKLADTLTRDAEQRADLFQRVLAPALEAEVQPKNFCVAGRQRGKRRGDLVVEEAVHRLFLGVGQLVRDEALDERPVARG